MPDNFGPQQPRVVSPEARSWDQPVFLNMTPFLSSELNLAGQIGSLKAQEALGSTVPSGWLRVEDPVDLGNLSGPEIVSAEGSALSGQVLTSLSYPSNTFKLISKDFSNIALVNGWKIIVQGSGAPVSDDPVNIITMPDGGTAQVDFVFLEVWKELVDFDDIIYPYGNVLAQPLPLEVSKNEILYNTIGVETSKRVQIRYRIRTRMGSSNPGVSLVADPEGFGPGVHPIGGRGIDNYNAGYEFVNQGPLDPGLWVSQPLSGPGTKTKEEMQADLQTVDGRVYAIPMFGVYRRAAGSETEPFSYANPHNARYEKLSGKHSDRPDNKYLDVIYKEDIIDLRHKVMVPGQDISDVVNKTLRRIVTGEHASIKGHGTGADGSIIDLSGGSTLLKADRIDFGDPSDPLMGDPSQNDGMSLKRRAYCNARLTQRANIHIIPNVGTWELNVTTDNRILIPESVPARVVSVDGVYGTHPDFTTAVTDITSEFIDDDHKVLKFTIGSGSNAPNLPGGFPLYVEFTVEYLPSHDGFKDVPKEFLEVRKGGSSLPIATRDNTVPIRGEDVTLKDHVNYEGGNYTDNYRFGHELVLYRSSVGSSTSLNPSDFKGYEVIGVKGIQRKKLDGTYGSHQLFDVTRSGGVYTLLSIGSLDETSTDVKITLYTKGKFFELSKQGRGVVEIYEMIEATAVEEPFGYFINTGDKPIVAIGTYAVTTGGAPAGTSYAFTGVGVETRIDLINDSFSPSEGDNINSNFPILDSNGYQQFSAVPTKYKLGEVGAMGGSGQTIKVPVLVHSYVPVTESYEFYYKINPYQGNMVGTVTGKIEASGPAIITSEGSGAIRPWTYGQNRGVAAFTPGFRIVNFAGDEEADQPQWLSYVRPGQYVRPSTSPYAYRIETVVSDIQILITEPFVGGAEITSYEIYDLDVPRHGFSNVIDRMPSYGLTDHLGESQDLLFIGGTMTTQNIFFVDTVPIMGTTEHQVPPDERDSYLDTLPTKRLQDLLDTLPDDFTLGDQTMAVRGRNGTTLTLGKNSTFKLGSKSHLIDYKRTYNGLYKKVFQSYVLNKNNSGRLYLVIISGETSNTPARTVLDGFNGRDTVDIYELIGRPLYK